MSKTLFYAIEAVEEALLENLSHEEISYYYPRYIGFIGEKVRLLCGEEEIEAVMLGVDDEGNLIAETEEGERKFSSAEVSLRG